MTLRQILYQIYVNFTLQMSVDRTKKRNLDTPREYLYLVGYVNAQHGIGAFPDGVEAVTVATNFMNIYEEAGNTDMVFQIDAAMAAGHWDQWPVDLALG